MKRFYKFILKHYNAFLCKAFGHRAHGPYEEVFKEWEMVDGRIVYLERPERMLKCQCQRCGTTLIKRTGATISRTKLRMLKNKYLKESA